jgi:type II secretion system protein N
MDAVTLEGATGARLALDRVTAKLRLLPLVLGRRALDYDARLYEGAVRGRAEERGGSQRLVARFDGVQLGQVAALRPLTGVDLAGAVNGDVDLAIDAKEPAKSSGHIDLAVADAAIRGGELKLAAMGGGALTLPRIGLGAVTAKGAVQDGKATFETLAAKGGDVEVNGEGLYFVVQPRLAQAPLFGKARLRFSEALWQKEGASGMRGLVEMALAPAKAPDGSYVLQIFGTLAAPRGRPAPAGG